MGEALKIRYSDPKDFSILLGQRDWTFRCGIVLAGSFLALSKTLESKRMSTFTPGGDLS